MQRKKDALEIVVWQRIRRLWFVDAQVREHEDARTRTVTIAVPGRSLVLDFEGAFEEAALLATLANLAGWRVRWEIELHYTLSASRETVVDIVWTLERNDPRVVEFVQGLDPGHVTYSSLALTP